MLLFVSGGLRCCSNLEIIRKMVKKMLNYEAEMQKKTKCLARYDNKIFAALEYCKHSYLNMN